ncbi:MAG: cytochrome b [Pseudomonadota bacterium]
MDVRPMRDRAKTASRYDLVAQMLHWTMAAILVYLIFFSHFEELPNHIVEQKIQLHAGLGALIIVLGALRFYWRLNRPRPAPIPNEPVWRARASAIVQEAFYALFIIAPAIGFILSGLVSYPVRVFGVFDVSGWLQNNEAAADTVNSLHGFSADVMTGLLVLHVGAALYHQFVKRDGLIWRMLPARR